MTFANETTWAIAALSILGMIVRPWRLPEAIWVVAGATMLLVLGLLPWSVALTAIAKGTDVYLFLIGMMLLAELARKEGLFDYLAARATQVAGGSATRLFALVYAVGTLITTFMSNDATAVVLTPAVFAATTAAKVKNPLPYLLICAFIANAASFVLPISNPANLVIFDGHMPPLPQWLARFALPSLLSIVVTCAVLWLTQRHSLRQEEIVADVEVPPLSRGGRTTACGIVATGALLLLVSGFGLDLGMPTFLAGLATASIVLLLKRESPRAVVKDISWEILPLVAGLFVLVEALDRGGLLKALVQLIQTAADRSVILTTWLTGVTLAIGSNLVNNLPAGLLAGSVISATRVPPLVTSAALAGSVVSAARVPPLVTSAALVRSVVSATRVPPLVTSAALVRSVVSATRVPPLVTSAALVSTVVSAARVPPLVASAALVSSVVSAARVPPLVASAALVSSVVSAARVPPLVASAALVRSVVSATRVPPPVVSAALVGIDLGPNLSVTGSLATILWLTALRREKLEVSAWTFLKLGVLVMPPALLLALSSLLFFHPTP